MGNATNKTPDSSVPPHILNLHNAARVHDVRGLKNAIAQFSLTCKTIIILCITLPACVRRTACFLVNVNE